MSDTPPAADGALWFSALPAMVEYGATLRSACCELALRTGDAWADMVAMAIREVVTVLRGVRVSDCDALHRLRSALRRERTMLSQASRSDDPEWLTDAVLCAAQWLRQELVDAGIELEGADE